MIRRLDRFIIMGHMAAFQAYKDSGLMPMLIPGDSGQ